MKKEHKVIQEKKNPSEKKTLFSLNIVVKLKFFYHFKKKFFPQEDQNI